MTIGKVDAGSTQWLLQRNNIDVQSFRKYVLCTRRPPSCLVLVSFSTPLKSRDTSIAIVIPSFRFDLSRIVCILTFAFFPVAFGVFPYVLERRFGGCDRKDRSSCRRQTVFIHVSSERCAGIRFLRGSTVFAVTTARFETDGKRFEEDYFGTQWTSGFERDGLFLLVLSYYCHGLLSRSNESRTTTI